jgi:integrase
MSSSPSFEKIGECLYRNPSSGSYYALVKIRGKQIKQSLKTSDLPEARRKLRDFKSDQARIDPDAGRITVSALCDRLEGGLSQSPKTLEKKKLVFSRIRDHWANVQARKVKKSDIKLWLASFSFGPPNYNFHLSLIHAVFALALDDRLISSNPAEGIEKKKLSKPIRPTPTFKQFQAIVGHIRGQQFSDTAEESADYVEFVGLAGLGRAETTSLSWGDISFERCQITTFRQKTKSGFVIPIYPQLLPLLEKRLAMAQEANGGKPPLPGTKVFSIFDPKKAIIGACSRLGLPRFSSRSLRRLFITTAIERGVDVKVIAQWQGHRDGGKLILGTYSHVRATHSEQMAKLMTVDQPENAIEIVNQA